ncbi:MoxR family ATPase [Flavobacterium agricola]|uniref:MoxR family ATPase n=1 Tax=Flavobacterium agricola TaxID=2870839 RepID=A0ABY6LVN8_9FLAO|nr:MoxR family ATPase [Flavobacterium agricola]UYW00394.1 MoxR family ATPase [Flavobacterium agricola]
MKENIHFENRLQITTVKQQLDAIREQIHKVVVGQDQIIDLLLIALLANGHILIEGVPGVAKTLLAKTLSKTINTGFSRIQFTPDLMPSDVLGTSIFEAHKGAFSFKHGPIFSNFVLIDEINRAPAKTQAALFEVMEEKQITVDGTTYPMEKPFIVVATQNPIEQEGTYRLPEAQLDRFIFKISVTYPTPEQEIALLLLENNQTQPDKLAQIQAVVSAQQITEFQQLTKQVLIEPHLIEYIAKLVTETRQNPLIYLGASPRASIAILNAAKAHAVLKGRDFVVPEDIQDVIIPVLNHRVILSPEKEMEGLTVENVIKQIINKIESPK